MFKLFKTKEEKQKELQEECDSLNEKYKDIFNIMCFRHNSLFTIKGFSIINDTIKLKFYFGEEGFVSIRDWSEFNNYYDLNEYYYESRTNFIKLKNKLKDFGYKITKINETK